MILIDSGFLYALFDENDRYHDAATAVIETNTADALVPDVTLVEVMYLVSRAGGTVSAIRFLDYFEQANFRTEALKWQDIRRAREVMTAYHDAHLDFVDTCIVAIAERLDVRRIATIDRRDFLIIRPIHCDYFELLPANV